MDIPGPGAKPNSPEISRPAESSSNNAPKVSPPASLS